MRSLSYQEADVFLLCYKISDPVSLYNVKSKWWPEIRRHRPDSPIVLCGCQQDLRADAATAAQLSKTGRAPVSQEQALAICCEVGAVNYVETSSKVGGDPTVGGEREVVAEAFELCALAAIKCGRVRRKASTSSGCPFAKSPSSAASSQKNLSYVSFGSVDKRQQGRHSGAGNSAASSLKKSAGNVSFSGSEANNANVLPILEDDVFPGYDDDHDDHDDEEEEEEDSLDRRRRASRCLPPLSPRFVRSGLDRRRRPHRSSLGVLRPAEEDFLHRAAAGAPMLTSTVKPPTAKTPSSSSSSSSSSAAAATTAQVRPNGLSRRTSFRQEQQRQQQQQQQQHQRGICIPVTSPKSPPVSPFDVQQQQQQQQRQQQQLKVRINNGDLSGGSGGGVGKKSPGGAAKVAGFESLKSHASTGSQGSTGSKASSSTDASSKSAGVGGVVGVGPVGSLMDPDVPDTEDPELLRQLNFVSPKTGVFRPVAGAGAEHRGAKAGASRKKQSCCIM